jgi:glycosyltransferase involved in cell wall biosynthesis
MRIVLDLQGCQSVSRLRGIGRYSLALAKAIVRNAGPHEVWIVLNDLFPDTVEDIRASFEGLLPDERVVIFSVPRFSLYQGANDWRSRAAVLIREHAIAELEPDLVHISSLFEGYVDESISSVKAFDKDTLVAVTLYDLIPFLSPDTYLSDVGFRKHYYDKIEALKRADVLLAISAYCGEEAVRELDISRERITNISSAVSESFVCHALTESERRALHERYGIKRPFVMTTGIVEPRKNLEGLIVAYAKLPVQLRQQYQLFMVCQAKEISRTKLFNLAKESGLARDDLVLSGYVNDDDLIALYQSCKLFVFPSLHEGFGLPALEAMACGAAVIGSATTSIPEVIGRDDALFDPLDTKQMTDMMQRGLSDTGYWESLRANAALQVPRFSWDATGRRALQSFEEAFTRQRSNHLDKDDAASPPSAAQTLTNSRRNERLSVDMRYRNLVDALATLDLPVSDADFIASADAIAANQRRGRARQLFVDVSVLCEHDAKSGIQRVTRAIVCQLLESPPAGWEVRPVRLDRSVMAYRYANQFMCGLNLGSCSVSDDDDWVDSNQGDVFLGLDLVADCVPPAEGWFAAQRRRGVKIYFVVYDLLPVLQPEWFPGFIAAVFQPWLTTLSVVADGLICISRAVADDLRIWLDASASKRLRELKLGYFHLGADIESSQPSTGLPDDSAVVLEALRARPTLVMVGTVEPRKGHVQTFAAFEQLWAANVDVNLVIVGKAGWGVDRLVKHLGEHSGKNERFFWLQGISDEYLEKIYSVSSGLLAASLGEGFGLPLIEAAQKGLPIIARDIPVFREVAGDHAFYFEGDTPGALASAVQTWLGLYAAKMAPSSSALPWMTWKQSAEQLRRVIFEDEWYATWLEGKAVDPRGRSER